jgi:pimeloyl-ACP methyl ester carboxylesterase
MLPYLSKLPYRLVAVDTLGHGRTSKPRDPAAYAYHLMVKDIFDIADNEGIQKVIPLGHDQGSGLAQRMYNHCPDRTAAVLLLNVAYSPPNKKEPFNLAAINATSKEVFGYPMFEYCNFLTAPDAAGLMNANLDRVMEIPHANSVADMQAVYGVPNAMREYLGDRLESVELKPYVNAKLKAQWRAELGEGGLEAPLCWYTAMVQ